MQITIEVPDRTLADAAEVGVSLREYAESLIRMAQEELARERGWNRDNDPEVFVRELSKFSAEIHSLPESAFTRDSISSDCD